MKKILFEDKMKNEMINSIRTSLRFSLKPYLEFMTESKGMINNIDEYINVIITKFKELSQNGTQTGVFKIMPQDFANISKRFAKNILVGISYDNTLDTQNIEGIYKDEYSKLNGTMLDNIVIGINAYGDYKTILKNLPEIISHEFLHAYENYNRLIKGSDNITVAAKQIGYQNNVKAIRDNQMSQNTVVQNIATLYYMCSTFERNAYLAQMKQQVKGNMSQIKDSESAYAAFENSRTYQYFLALGRNLFYVLNNKEQYKQEIEEWHESVFNTHLSGGKVLKRLYNLYNKTWTKIRKSMASYIKYLYEINEDTNYFYDNFTNIIL